MPSPAPPRPFPSAYVGGLLGTSFATVAAFQSADLDEHLGAWAWVVRIVLLLLVVATLGIGWMIFHGRIEPEEEFPRGREDREWDEMHARRVARRRARRLRDGSAPGQSGQDPEA